MNDQHIQELSIQGMSCTSCSSRIERTLLATPGVTRAVVDFAMRTAVVETALAFADLEKIINQAGFRVSALGGTFEREERERREQSAARQRLIWAVVLLVPVMFLGMTHSLANLSWARIVSGVLTTGLLLGPGRLFFTNAYLLLLRRTANMDTLVALGAGLSFVWSLFQTVYAGQHVYFETSAAIVSFVLIGKFIEHRMSWRATSSLGTLLSLQPRKAQRFVGEQLGDIEEVDVRFLRSGDLLQARVGERFAADGTVVEGVSEADESLLTGESLPVVKTKDSSVVAGSLNLSAVLIYRAERVGPQTRLGEIVAFVERTRLSKAPLQRLVDKVSAIFVPVILGLSVLTFLTWFVFLKSNLFDAMNAAVSVLVVACPCALGLATPIALAVATTRAARLGILFRDLAALEALQGVQTLVLDKTGTLTLGQLKVVEEHLFSGVHPSQELYGAIVSLEKISQHPVAAAVVDAIVSAGKHGVGSYPIGSRREIVGQGVEAEIELAQQKQTLWIGQPNEAEMRILPPRDTVTWVVCRVNGVPVIGFALRDTLRPESASLVSEFKSLSIKPIVVSGDRLSAVRDIANILDLEHLAEQTPQMKANFIAYLQKSGDRVAMLGDGVNDAPALAQADVGIAVSSGTDAARDTAAVTLKTSTLSGALTAFHLSKSTFRNIRQNLFWAFAYNVVLLPLAMGGKLTPMWAAAAMAFSSLFVVLNSLRLLRFENLKG